MRVRIKQECQLFGLNEILVLVLLIGCIFILPRLLNKGQASTQQSLPFYKKKLGAFARVGIVLSIAYPAGLSLYLKPWEGHWVSFCAFGLFPILLVWGIAWVMAGKKK